MSYIITGIISFAVGCISGMVVMALCAVQKYDKWGHNDEECN